MHATINTKHNDKSFVLNANSSSERSVKCLQISVANAIDEIQQQNVTQPTASLDTHARSLLARF